MNITIPQITVKRVTGLSPYKSLAFSEDIRKNIVTAAVGLFVLSILMTFLVISLYSGEWSLFPRAGAVIVASAAQEKLWQGWIKGFRSITAVIGTLIWGFGDLLQHCLS